MFIVLLKFSVNKKQAGQFMDKHVAWIKRGFDEGVFLLTGSLQAELGGAIVAHNTTRSALESRINNDPFVIEHVVDVELIEISPSKVDERLNFLLN